MKTNVRLGLFPIVVLQLVSIGKINGQSLKKTFKYIEDGEIAEASLEVNQFTDKVKESDVDFTLYGLASCLIVCNEKNQRHDPYKAFLALALTPTLI